MVVVGSTVIGVVVVGELEIIGVVTAVVATAPVAGTTVAFVLSALPPFFARAVVTFGLVTLSPLAAADPFLFDVDGAAPAEAIPALEELTFPACIEAKLPFIMAGEQVEMSCKNKISSSNFERAAFDTINV